MPFFHFGAPVLDLEIGAVRALTRAYRPKRTVGCGAISSASVDARRTSYTAWWDTAGTQVRPMAGPTPLARHQIGHRRHPRGSGSWRCFHGWGTTAMSPEGSDAWSLTAAGQRHEHEPHGRGSDRAHVAQRSDGEAAAEHLATIRAARPHLAYATARLGNRAEFRAARRWDRRRRHAHAPRNASVGPLPGPSSRRGRSPSRP